MTDMKLERRSLPAPDYFVAPELTFHQAPEHPTLAEPAHQIQTPCRPCPVSFLLTKKRKSFCPNQQSAYSTTDDKYLALSTDCASVDSTSHGLQVPRKTASLLNVHRLHFLIIIPQTMQWLGLVVHAYNPSIGEAKAKRSQVLG